MMHTFLANNRDDLIARCKAKVAKRPHRDATERQLKNGVPLFLEQLRRTLQAEEADKEAESLKISGASGGDAQHLSEVGVSAAAHGKQLLELGFSINQVVHDYGDLWGSIAGAGTGRVRLDGNACSCGHRGRRSLAKGCHRRHPGAQPRTPQGFNRQRAR